MKHSRAITLPDLIRNALECSLDRMPRAPGELTILPISLRLANQRAGGALAFSPITDRGERGDTNEYLL